MRLLSILSAIYCLCSCIRIEERLSYEGGWVVLENQFSPLAEQVEVELYDGTATIIADGWYVGAGDYVYVNESIVFGWTVEWSGISVLMLDASMVDSNTMAFRWKPLESFYPCTSLFVRQSE